MRASPVAAALAMCMALGAASSVTSAPGTLPASTPAPPATAPPATAPRARITPGVTPAGAGYSTRLPAGRFGKVTVYIPDGDPKSVAIFFSGDSGWDLGVIPMARALTGMGAVVIGVDIRQYFASLHRAAQRADAPCQMIAADLENLSHQVQKEIGMGDYHVPVLVGYSSGATVVYAALVQSPPGTFAGALSLGFCADQDFEGAALCPGAGLHYRENQQHALVFEPSATLRQPWVALQGQKDQVCDSRAADEFAAQVTGGAVVKLPLVGHGFSVERNWMPQFRQTYGRLVPHIEPRPRGSAEIADLPVEEVHASGSGDEFALLLTGDGGWAGLDQELAARLAANGVPTAGLNS